MSVWKGVDVARRVEDFREPLVRHPADIPVLTAGLYPVPRQVKEPEPEKVPEPTHVLPAPIPERPLVARVRTPIEPLAPRVVELSVLDATVNIRPWGYVAVDGKDRSAEALAVPRLKLP